MSPNDSAVRELLASVLAWDETHATYDAAVADLPAELRGRMPAGLPYSPWQLVEHLRITQHDLLDFCRNPDYHELAWPDEYWPKSAAPASDTAWDESLQRYREDRAALQALARDPRSSSRRASRTAPDRPISGRSCSRSITRPITSGS